ncbi:hypothetical protein PFISCL1PPCAC_4367 [Pristionchus fissidentatus]|uniref:WW domain-containing protein n=1 Tax=Pristionchus fissidentatus TaxID=1538716 RepID=A0AAV5V0J9_9BILA|nr:hypothetical protein PFISCL1PPCAC_4367 [Pristionchus fissidentatus]
MPLPPALAARLKKRGIIQEKEEVLAYDDAGDKDKNDDEENFSAGAPGCPNKYNQFHVCVDYCFDHWQDGTPESRLSEQYQHRRKRMLNKYPLPEGWTEVYEAGMSRHYYWCPETDEVSWLSPRHPHAVIGEAAPKIATELAKERERDAFVPSSAPTRGGNRDGDKRRDDERNERRGVKRREERGSPTYGESDEEDAGKRGDKEMSDKDRFKRATKKGIDPMDPAAYSDVSQGKWSSGLFEDDKSGVDTTAGGPLFQMRPYPSPGAILRARGKKNDEDI